MYIYIHRFAHNNNKEKNYQVERGHGRGSRKDSWKRLDEGKWGGGHVILFQLNHILKVKASKEDSLSINLAPPSDLLKRTTQITS